MKNPHGTTLRIPPVADKLVSRPPAAEIPVLPLPTMAFGRPTAEDDARAAAWREWLQKRNPLAIASFVLGVFSLIEFGAVFIFGVAGIILGVLALRQLKRQAAAIPAAVQVVENSAGEATEKLGYADRAVAFPPIEAARYEADEMPVAKTHGHWLAIAGITCGVASLILAAVFTYRWI